MMQFHSMVDQFQGLETPFYYYDTDLLRSTVEEAKKASTQIPNASIHFAVKSNANPAVLSVMRDAGLGADCVSGGEIETCVKAGIPASQMMFAGVGKTDREIRVALSNNILCFNVESIQEIAIIGEIANEMNCKARIALRVNPNIDAHTHEFITTGLEENKFGISIDDMMKAVRKIKRFPTLSFYGLHFHIGSQILNYNSFVALSHKINEIQDQFDAAGIPIQSINVGGGLGVDYEKPEIHPIPDFQKYFSIFKRYLKLRQGQSFYCELGRALSAQCGVLVTRTVLVKDTTKKHFAVVDAGFTDLIRPALYGATHKIVNLSNHSANKKVYDVVGPICESSDVFVKDVKLPVVRRGDLLALLTAGAYGFVMASTYNCRSLPKEYTTEDFSLR